MVLSRGISFCSAYLVLSSAYLVSSSDNIASIKTLNE